MSASVHDDVATAPAPTEADLSEIRLPFLNGLNDSFADSLLLVGRVFGDRRSATKAVAVEVDPRGIDLLVTDGGAEHPVRVEFERTITDITQITLSAINIVIRAREQSGEEGSTSAEELFEQMTGIRTFVTEVVRVEEVHPHLRRITFGGGDLVTFTPKGPDTFLYVLLPPAGRTELTIDQGFSWELYGTMPDDEKPLGAYYTLRAWRPDVVELDMLFVLHGDSGPASAWAATAKPGDPVALWGPRTAYSLPAGTDALVLVGDDTGLPAIATILEQLPAGTTAKVFAEVDRAAEQQELPTAPDIEVTWLHRNGAAAGTTTLLDEAIRAADWPDGTVYVWGGGESRTMTGVRRYVRKELGLAREAVSLVAYWRHAAHTDDPDEFEG